MFFRRLSLFTLRFSKALSDLGFFSESFAQRALNSESGVFLGSCLGPETPLFCVPKTAKKSSPFLSLVFFGVLFLLRRVFAEGFGAFGQRTLCFALALFPLVPGAFLYGFTCEIQGVLFSPFFRDSGAAVSGSSSLLFLLLLPPFFSWGRPGLLFFSSALAAVRTAVVEGRSDAAFAHAMLLSFFSPLSARPAPLSLALFFRFFFSLSLSLSLSLLHASV